MRLRRVLVLQSVEDEITERRSRRMRESPFLRGNHFEQFYAIELTKEQRRQPTPLMMQQVENATLDETELTERLTRSIDRFKPNVLVVHLGFVFRRYSEAMLAALATIKARFPHIKIGVEHSERLTSMDPGLKMIFDESKEIQDLVAEIF
jgi:hypothetical protein